MDDAVLSWITAYAARKAMQCVVSCPRFDFGAHAD